MRPVRPDDAHWAAEVLWPAFWLVLAFVLAVVGALYGVPIYHAVHHLWWPEGGEGYAFFSSIGYQIFGVPILALLYLRKNNCHQKGCPWIGRYPAVEGNSWHYCRFHHTDNGVHR